MLFLSTLLSLFSLTLAVLTADFDHIPSNPLSTLNTTTPNLNAPLPLSLQDGIHYSPSFHITDPAPSFIPTSPPNVLCLPNVPIGTIQGSITKVSSNCTLDVYSVSIACVATAGSGAMLPVPCIVGISVTGNVSVPKGVPQDVPQDVPEEVQAEYLGGGTMLDVELGFRGVHGVGFRLINPWLVNPEITPVGILVDSLRYDLN
ncbi:MAG: hypothetical protein MMC23_005058 [Stictis urceolatum]|nr:hypothetical protein [Stictis urceolata]